MFAACNLPFLDMTYNLAPQAGLHTGAAAASPYAHYCASHSPLEFAYQWPHPALGLALAGCLDIVNTRGKLGRMQGLDFMLKSEAGRHLDLPIVRCTKATPPPFEFPWQSSLPSTGTLFAHHSSYHDNSATALDQVLSIAPWS